ncbi:hypothetical protein WA026_013249 [Henosepilachna vigintioctopunctata]|uniref:Glutathione transferase n=1 Tax=Henosepilachna vigintioctopunctata TaxID=420089 RepID=A0AAW1UBB2_9CUCU
MKAPKLYSLLYSPPARSVLLTARAIGLKLEIQTVDLGKKEQLTPDFLAKNPQHTIPTLEEPDGFVVWDSHAIMPYIVEKYASDDSFYPKDLRKRAVIQQRLHFDTMSGIVRSNAINPLFHEGATTIQEKTVETIKGHYSLLEKFLEKSEWIAGDTITIADFSLIPSIATSNIIVPVDEKDYPKVKNWLKKAESWEYYDENKIGHEALEALILERLRRETAY